MTKIKLYTTDNNIEDDDKVVGTDFTGDHTKNYEMSAIKSYVGSTSVVTTKVTLTPAQLLSLNGGGTIELIEAPGAGKVINIISYASFLDFNTTAYNFSGFSNMGLFYGEQTLPIWAVDVGQSINVSSDYYYFPTKSYGSTYQGVANASIEFKGDAGTTVTQGDSPLKINILYRIVDFS